MYCPICGAPDQKPEAFCRSCGIRLPDLGKLVRTETPTETHLKANAVLSLLTGLTSLVLAVLLYAAFLGKDGTPVLVYVTAGFLTAIFAWQVQVFWRTALLYRRLAQKPETEPAGQPERLQIAEADFENRVPFGVTETNTRNLGQKVRR